MPTMAPRVRRLLSLPWPILAAKLIQRGHALVHRLSTRPSTQWPRVEIPSLTLETIRARLASRFFLPAHERFDLVSALKSLHPHGLEALHAAASNVCAHRFDLLGSGPTTLGPAIDWHRDFKSGHSWPLKHHSALDYLDLGHSSDAKVVWELSRCHHWIVLGQAYWVSADDRYAEEFVAQWESWMLSNPLGFGINWTSAMEAAIRAVNWLWTFVLFLDAPAFDEARQRRFAAALAEHARFILRNLEFGSRPGNHYLTNGVGLLTLGLMLPELPGAPRWLKRGWQIVWGQVEHQITSDGVDYEHAIGYHGYVLQCLLFVTILCRQHQRLVPTFALERIRRMLNFTLAYVRPDGTVPAIGDNDDGQLLNLGHDSALDHRALLVTGAAVLGCSDFKRASVVFGRTNLWWLGLTGLRAYESLPSSNQPVTSCAFPLGDSSSCDRATAIS